MVSGSLANMPATHGRFDGPGANRIDANASGGISKSIGMGGTANVRIEVVGR
jgi:hypothetical protein